MSTIDPDAIYTMQHACSLTGVAYLHIYVAIHSGELTCARESRVYQIAGHELLAWLASRPQPAPTDTLEPLSKDEIRDLRLRLGLSQAKFATRLGCAQPLVSLWELGRNQPGPKYRRVLRQVMEEVEEGQGVEG